MSHSDQTTKKTGSKARWALMLATILATQTLIPAAAHAIAPLVAIAVGSLVVGSVGAGAGVYSATKGQKPVVVNVTCPPRHQKRLLGKKRPHSVTIKAACYRVPRYWVGLPNLMDMLRGRGLDKEIVRVCFPSKVVKAG